ncbi:MAG: site-specific integrase [bacterium]|nr:site-specific integrase [bacterium]
MHWRLHNLETAMSAKRPSRVPTSSRSRGCAQLERHAQTYRQYLLDRGNAAGYVRSCEAAVAHLSVWMRHAAKRLSDVDELLVAEFVKRHLPRCNCVTNARHPATVRAALGHLLVVLRASGAVAPRPEDATPVGQELRRFAHHMAEVRGLAAGTRTGALRLVEALLRKHFGDGPFRFDTITPEHVRRFFAAQAKLHTTSSSLGVVVSALRGYFRWRASLGDRTHALVGAVSYPANWQQASLPKSLEPTEVEQLVDALGQNGPSMRRADAMVRCALDLGLRSGEVARLSLDDIDWDAGTITLRQTKGRREDVMPLPQTTGQAIAAYLRHERPKTEHRMVFARHMTPRERPIGPDLVRKTIRQAYARAGLAHTRAHLLRHTMASRLLAGGSSLKEVADVLRHRSLNTTLIYAKLDSRRLVEVALPWPGTATSGAAGCQS